MNRSAKKFVYGLFYLCLFALLAYWIFGGIFKGAPTETPACTNCVAQSQIAPLTVTGSVQLWKSGDMAHVMLLGQVQNSNSGYGVSQLPYTFTLFDKNGAVVGTVQGTESVFPGETKYIFGMYDGSAYDVGRAARASLTLSNPQWVTADRLIAPNVAVTEGPATTVSQNGIEISGSVQNTSPLASGTIKVIALLGNKYGDPIAAGQTLLGGLQSLDQARFSIFFPADATLISKTDPSFTRVFISVEN